MPALSNTYNSSLPEKLKRKLGASPGNKNTRKRGFLF